ncbi:hypothetical protein ABEB36_012757 [Hypothenemus hampei]|uniref:Uncharacterized protein n=1 Tax=Hypothenemus hampei TaxID=57062 RepID=A0ABD1ECM6_HYPHA
MLVELYWGFNDTSRGIPIRLCIRMQTMRLPRYLFGDRTTHNIEVDNTQRALQHINQDKHGQNLWKARKPHKEEFREQSCHFKSEISLTQRLYTKHRDKGTLQT